uniref:Uncharacterized protein n=1 Tax=Alexandrium monilatum TaxID=311494 RepID=A0A7S4VFC8_9DINO
MVCAGVVPAATPAAAAAALLTLFALLPHGVGAQRWPCPHCEVGGGFEEFLRPEEGQASVGGFSSDVHVLWPAHVEVIPITSDIGGWEPPSFHRRLAEEAIRGWRMFRSRVVPGLPKHHHLRQQLMQKHAGALNDAFFHWQKKLFEERGDVGRSLAENDGPSQTPHPDANTSWPEMCGLPEYQRLRKIVDRLSRRYLVRSGMHPTAASALNYSIFNWAAVHGPGEFHGPHTHVGEYHVGVFYAQAGPAAGKLRFGDPRGHSPPFARSFFHTPRSGDLVLFPSWLSHMATVTAPSSDVARGEGREPLRVVFSFNIGPVSGPLPCHLWWSDPTGDMRFRRRSPIDVQGLGL